VVLFSLGGATSAFQRQDLTVDTRVRRMMEVVTVTGQADNGFAGGRPFFFSRQSYVNARYCMRPSRRRQNFRIPHLPEILVADIDKLAAAFERAKGDVDFLKGKADIAVAAPQTLRLVDTEGAGGLGRIHPGVAMRIAPGKEWCDRGGLGCRGPGFSEKDRRFN
jgi:hypothetical protein